MKKTSRGRKSVRFLRWIFRRDNQLVTCQLERGMVRSEYAVSIVPHWNVACAAVETFDAVVAAFERHAALAVAEGTPVSTLLDSGYPRVHFSRKGAVEMALRHLSAARLAAIIDQLGTAALDMRKQASLASAIAQRTLLSIAANAKRRG